MGTNQVEASLDCRMLLGSRSSSLVFWLRMAAPYRSMQIPKLQFTEAAILFSVVLRSRHGMNVRGVKR